MLFDSLEFTIFLPIVFALYWLAARWGVKLQNFIVVVSSYVFYAWWDYRLLSLIIFSTLLDYFIGNQIGLCNLKSKRKWLLGISLFANLGLLGFFKYYNFFIDSFSAAFSFLGYPIADHSLYIILPIGISFYTFQTMSYTIDVYKRKLVPTDDILAFMSFVGFFPQLVAGPIEKARDLLPQFYKKREKLDYAQAVDGLRQSLFGLFKKVVIADNCAPHVNAIFENTETLSGSTLLLGVTLFSFQIYGDFSGYSDIAIGISRLFGIKLTRNFVFPYFSRDMAEYWRSWHISISKWFRDYVYIPLGGSRGGKWRMVRNTFIVFMLSGIWHGANWTFVVWAFFNFLLFIPLVLANKNRDYVGVIAQGRYLPTIKESFQMLNTFLIRLPATVFFRATTFKQGFAYISGIFSLSLFTIPQNYGVWGTTRISVLILIMLIIEWFGRSGEHALSNLNARMNKPLRWIFYSVIIFIIGLYMSPEEVQFIYYQF